MYTLVKLMLPKVKIKKTGQKGINYYLDQQISVMIKIGHCRKQINLGLILLAMLLITITKLKENMMF